MVHWTCKYVPSSSCLWILEVGSRNGTLLLGLLDAEYQPERLCGIDYSEGSVKLARLVSTARGGDNILFHLCDFLKDDPPKLPSMLQENTDWDLIMDKGTFNAIGLMEKDSNGIPPADGYPLRIGRLLKPGGYFLITCMPPSLFFLDSYLIILHLQYEACNFTEEELIAKFASPQTGLTYHSRIQHATYTYGGKSGSICSSVAFWKQL
jgi:EEF1A lysine methyltransferase 2